MTKAKTIKKAVTETVAAPTLVKREIPMVNLSEKHWAGICEKENLITKSAKIRWLAAQEHPRAAIARFLNIRYQHVRNVLTQPIKRVVEVPAPTPTTK